MLYLSLRAITNACIDGGTKVEVLHMLANDIYLAWTF
jgi:hypothetical protein